MESKGMVEIYDTLLRDGTQGEGINYTVRDKLAVAQKLDELGVAVIEGGWPGSNPRDVEFFAQVRRVQLSHAGIAAFGSTVRPGKKASADAQIQALLRAETSIVTIVAKTWDFHVREDLRIPLEQNMELIARTVAYLKKRTDRVILDAEHFFDGFVASWQYALDCLQVAKEAGVDLVCLCDTRGGSLTQVIARGVTGARALGIPIGIHCHDDSGLAVANTLKAVECGAVQVQGTINGFGERCGNANLCTVIPDLQLKMGYVCLPPDQLRRLTEVSRFCAELANVESNRQQPFVGRSAFAHKGGLHASAVRKNRVTYEHIDPAIVGNEQRVLLSDLSGRSNLHAKAEEFGLDVEGRADEVVALLQTLKTREALGWQFEGAEGSFELLMRRKLAPAKRYFRLVEFRVINAKHNEDEPTVSEATIQISLPDDSVEHTAGTGNGPVNALDLALRKALRKFYPSIDEIILHDYKVRVLEVTNGDGKGTAQVVRVVIESGDGVHRWGTVGVSHNVVEASWQALVDSIVYKFLKDEVGWNGAQP